MSADKEDKFDEMLRRGLRRHTEPVPSDFSERVLRQIREAEERRILARVVWEGRLALAGYIALGIIAIVAVVVFPDIAIIFTKQTGGFIDKIGPAITAISGKWQLYYTVFAVVFGFAVYSFMDLLVGES